MDVWRRQPIRYNRVTRPAAGGRDQQTCRSPGPRRRRETAIAAVPTLDIRAARRLALAKAGLLKPEWTGLPRSGGRGERRQRAAAHAIIRRFGYLQLDTVAIAGARSHALVLLSRLDGFDAALAERLLQPDEPLFEYWGHEASWMPLDFHPLFEFRRQGMRRNAYWKRWMHGQTRFARDLVQRIRQQGPLRSADLEGRGDGGWWGHKPAKRVVVALWSSGELAVRERSNFQRTFDVPERVLPRALLETRVPRPEAIRRLVGHALGGHGWATSGTLAATWRLRNMRPEIGRALASLQESGDVMPCVLRGEDGRLQRGWIHACDLELAERLRRVRPDPRRGVLLSPFDPVLWDRGRVQLLFDFEQLLEIFKPVAQRRFGYFCLPVLAGEHLIARVDLKAERAMGRVRVLSCRFESTGTSRAGSASERAALETALVRHGNALDLDIDFAALPAARRRGARATRAGKRRVP